MDQAHCGSFILCSCSHHAFVWLNVAVKLAARFLKKFSDQEHTAQR